MEQSHDDIKGQNGGFFFSSSLRYLCMDAFHLSSWMQEKSREREREKAKTLSCIEGNIQYINDKVCFILVGCFDVHIKWIKITLSVIVIVAVFTYDFSTCAHPHKPYKLYMVDVIQNISYALYDSRPFFCLQENNPLASFIRVNVKRICHLLNKDIVTVKMM